VQIGQAALALQCVHQAGDEVHEIAGLHQPLQIGHLAALGVDQKAQARLHRAW
jgi:hypothetical protein